MTCNKFCDRIDISETISLFEYGLIRNPKTDKVIYCVNPNTNDKPIIKSTYISFVDVKEAIENQSEGYFDFIGSSKQAELNNLDNNYLTVHIMSIEQYNGYFQLD